MTALFSLASSFRAWLREMVGISYHLIYMLPPPLAAHPRRTALARHGRLAKGEDRPPTAKRHKKVHCANTTVDTLTP